MCLLGLARASAALKDRHAAAAAYGRLLDIWADPDTPPTIAASPCSPGIEEAKAYVRAEGASSKRAVDSGAAVAAVGFLMFTVVGLGFMLAAAAQQVQQDLRAADREADDDQGGARGAGGRKGEAKEGGSKKGEASSSAAGSSSADEDGPHTPLIGIQLADVAPADGGVDRDGGGVSVGASVEQQEKADLI